MALGGIYETGTVTIAVGGVNVTGVGTLWSPIVEVGDWLFIGGQVGLIGAVVDDTHLTLETAWQGTLPSAAAYLIIKMSWLRYDPALTQAKVRELLEHLQAEGHFIFVEPGGEPDDATGEDDQWALDASVTPWKLWHKEGGVWVEQAPPGAVIVDDQVTPPMLDADTAAKQEEFRVRLYAAPFDALAYNGMQVNGSMDVDQPNAGVAVAAAAGSVTAFLMDGWKTVKTGTNAFSIQQTTSVFTGYTKELKLTVTTAQASIGSDTIDIRQHIEGYRIARLAWGTASAIPLTIGFWVKSSVAGTLPLYASDSTLATSVVTTVTITSANVAQFVTATFAAQTTGTWLTTNGVGIILSVRPANTGNINIAATNGNTFEMTGVVILPGTQAPTAARSPLIMRPYDQELVTCQRYWEKIDINLSNGGPVASVNNNLTWTYRVIKRTTPTHAWGAGSTVFSIFSAGTTGINVYATGVAPQIGAGSTADARL